MVTFLDDMHMPTKEVCGAQPPLELIRQWIDYGFWHDQKKLCPKYVKKMLLICAMSLFNKTQHPISSRMMSCFSVVNITTPEENDIFKIYKTILSQHLTNFDETVSELGRTQILIILNLHVLYVSNEYSSFIYFR